MSVVSLYIPTATSLLTQLRTITPFINPALTLSFVVSSSSLCIKPHLLFTWTLLYSAPAPSRWTWLEKKPWIMLTDLTLNLCAQISMRPFLLESYYFLFSSSPRWLFHSFSFLKPPNLLHRPPAQLMTASHFTEGIEAIRENFPHLPPCCYLLPLSVPLYWALFPINEGELCLFLTKPDLPRVGLISPLLIHAKKHDRK